MDGRRGSLTVPTCCACAVALVLVTLAGRAAAACTEAEACAPDNVFAFADSSWAPLGAPDKVENTTDLLRCCAKCSGLPGCVLYDYAPSSGLCHLYALAGRIGLDAPLGASAGTQAVALTAASWRGSVWAGGDPLPPPDGARFDATPDGCAAACADTCGCTYWSLNGAGRCWMLAQPPSGVAPRLVDEVAGAAGVLLGPSLQLSLVGQDAAAWDAATYGAPYDVAGVAAAYNAEGVAAAVESLSLPGALRSEWGTNETLARGRREYVTVSIANASLEALGLDELPAHLELPLELPLALQPARGNGTWGAAEDRELAVEEDGGVQLPGKALQALAFTATYVDVTLPVSLTYEYVRCSSDGRGGNANGSDLISLFAKDANVGRVGAALARLGFCGSISEGEGGTGGGGGGYVTVMGELALELPTALREVTLAQEGERCAAPFDICDTPALLPDSRWFYFPLPTPETPLPDLPACCAACAAHPDCVFYDYAADGRCTMYDWRLMISGVSKADGGGADAGGGLVDRVAAAQLPLIEAAGTTAGLVDTKRFPSHRWSLDVLQELAIPAGAPTAGWCASRCNTVCGCTYWTADGAAQRCLLHSAAVSGALLVAEEHFICGLKLGRSLDFEAPTVDIAWDEVAEGAEETIEMAAALAAGNDTADSLPLPVPLTWQANETLHYWAEVGDLSLSLGNGSGLDGGALVGDSLGPFALPLARGTYSQTVYPLVALAEPQTLPDGGSGGAVQVSARVRVVQVATPARVTRGVNRCGEQLPDQLRALQDAEGATDIDLLGELAGALTNQPRAFDALLASLLPIDMLLRRAGFCGGALGGEVAETRGAEMVVQVGGLVQLRLPLEVVEAAVEDGRDGTGCAPRFGRERVGGDLFPGLCAPSASWQQCCDRCRDTRGCSSWSWNATLGGGAPEGGCPHHCALKGGNAMETAAAAGVVSGSVLPQADACGAAIPDYAIASSDPDADERLSVDSYGRCCAACALSPRCAAFTFDFTGECSLKRDVAGGSALPGAFSSIAPDSAGGSGSRARRLEEDGDGSAALASCPAPVQVSAGGGLVSVVGSGDASWQEVCCFNALPDCRDVAPGQLLLLPCPGEADGRCDAAEEVPTASATAGGCRCAASFDFTDGDGRSYDSAGACLTAPPPGTDPPGESLPRGWCFVEDGSCEDEGETAEADGRRWAACEGEAGGCELLEGVELLQGGGPDQPAAGLNNGAAMLLPSAPDCCSLCQVTANCTAFNFLPQAGGDGGDGSERGECWLLSNVTGTTLAPRAVSGLSQRREEGGGGRRRLLQEDTCTPTALPLLRGEDLSALPPADLRGLSWRQLCCFNGALGNCTDAPADVALVVPCPGDPALEDGCAAAERGFNVEVVTESTNAIIPIAVGIPVALLGLAAGLLAGVVVSRVYLKRKRGALELQAAGLDGAYALARGGTLPPPDQGRTPKYDWDAGAVVRGAECTVVGGRAAGGRHVVAKFFDSPAAYERQRLLLKANPAPGSLPTVYDSYCSGTRNGPACLVMERGNYSAATWRRQPASRSPHNWLAMLRDVADALQALHASGYVHGDVCPEHVVWCNAAHCWKLIGTHAWAEAGTEITPPSTVNLRYAAPEVAKALHTRGPMSLVARPASDMWSLGCLVWEACTGEPLFGNAVGEDEVGAMLRGDAPLPYERHKALWMAFEEEQARRLAQHLLRRSGPERWPASRALSHALLRATDNAVTAAGIKELRAKVLDLSGNLRQLAEMDAAALRQQASAALAVSVAFEEVVGEPQEQQNGGQGNGGQATHAAAARGAQAAAWDSDGGDSGSESGSLPVDIGPALSAHKEAEKQRSLYTRYQSGALKTHDAPLTLLSVLEGNDIGGEGGGAEPVVMLRSERRYIMRLWLQYGGAALMPLPIEGCEGALLAVDEVEEAAALEVQALKDECGASGWAGFAVWDTSGCPLGRTEVELGLTLRMKGSAEVVKIRKTLTVQLCSPSDSFSVERVGMQAVEAWASTPEWVKLGAKGIHMLYNLGFD